MYEQRVESQYQKDKAVLIICILLTISFAIFILMYISNRNKIHISTATSYEKPNRKSCIKRRN